MKIMSSILSLLTLMTSIMPVIIQVALFMLIVDPLVVNPVGSLCLLGRGEKFVAPTFATIHSTFPILLLLRSVGLVKISLFQVVDQL